MIDKIELRDTHIHLTPDRFNKTLPLLIMSHGSGGISDIDYDFANIACTNGYQVAIIDHFTSRGVKSQIWHSVEDFYPSFDDRVKDICTVSSQYTSEKKILFGISAGGTAVLSIGSEFDKTFCVYPALVGVTEQMLSAKNITIVTGQDDNWTPVDQAERYSKYVDVDLHIVPGYHGFLNPREDRYLPEVISLRNISLPIPFISTLDTIDYEKGVNVKYHKASRIYTENLFKEWLS